MFQRLFYQIKCFIVRIVGYTLIADFFAGFSQQFCFCKLHVHTGHPAVVVKDDVDPIVDQTHSARFKSVHSVFAVDYLTELDLIDDSKFIAQQSGCRKKEQRCQKRDCSEFFQHIVFIPEIALCRLYQKPESLRVNLWNALKSKSSAAAG